MTRLSILYDAQCPFCLRCRQWLGSQPPLLLLDFIPFQSPELVARFEGIEAFRTGNQLLVVGNDLAVYQGSSAFIMLLYALRDYREWSFRLATPALMPLAARCFALLCSGRKSIAKWLNSLNECELLELLSHETPLVCTAG